MFRAAAAPFDGGHRLARCQSWGSRSSAISPGDQRGLTHSPEISTLERTISKCYLVLIIAPQLLGAAGPFPAGEMRSLGLSSCSGSAEPPFELLLR